jgi:multidrug efflux system membrane fusion protein
MIDQTADKAGRGIRPAKLTRTSRPGGVLRWLIWGLVGLLVIGGVVYIVYPRQAAQTARGGRFAASGPMPVATVAAAKGDMPIVLGALGTVTPLATVTVKTQINGQLTQIAFQEGQTVHKGDFLAEIDPRPYQAALDQMQGQLLRDQALLRNAEVDLQRYRTLVSQDSIARQQLDTQEALVRQYQGTVKADQAMVDNAKLNLAYCHIASPATGRVGLRQVDQGNYVQVSDANGLVVITQEQPITVIFTLPEDNLPAVLKRLRAGATLAVTAYDRSQQTKLATGVLSTVDNQIDTTTGTVKLRAQFANDDEALFPNQFVNVQLLVDTQHDAIVVPSSAIQRGAPGTFVYEVQPDSTVKVVAVKLGPTSNDQVAIASGLKEGDKVVTDGADKLRDGAKVALPDANKAAAGATGDAGAQHGQHAGQQSGQQTGQPAAPQAGQTDNAGQQRGQGRRRNSQ